MAQFPALPLWTDALLADCGHLSDAEFGLYLRLLIMMWRNPNTAIPDDDEWLARHLRRSVDDVRRDVRPIISEFCAVTEIGICQMRLIDEKAYVKNKSRVQKNNAKKRWSKNKSLENNENDPCHGNAAWHDVGNAPTPTPTVIEKDKDKSLSKKKTDPKKGTRIPADWMPTDADIDFAKKEGFDDEAIRRIADSFRDYWSGATGANATKRDWSATWRNWIRKRKDEQGRGFSGGKQPPRGRQGPASVVGAYSELARGFDTE